MGNPATPSKACEPCRLKRRKCDKKLSGCSQCRRAKLACPGYRDDFFLRLRDQTASTARRVQKLQRSDHVSSMVRPPAIGSPIMRRGSALDMRRVQIVPNTPVVGKLQACPEALALGFFLNVYAPTALFDYLPEASTLFLHQGPLNAAILAPSLLLFSQNFRLTTLEPLARRKYIDALSLINFALSRKEWATHDSTLLTVLLLSLYEALVFRGRQAPSSWCTHIKGAVQLLQLRGKKQLESSLGRRLFLHASSNVRIDCTQRCIKPPPILGALQDILVRAMDPRDPKLRLGAILEGFADILAETEGPLAPSRFYRALELDRELAILSDDLWKIAPFQVAKVTSLPRHINTLEDCVHQYTSQRNLKLWNSIRIFRLFLSQFLHSCLTVQSTLENLQSEQWSQVRTKARAVATKMISGVFASVPLAFESPENSMVSARSLIYPLSGVAVSSLASPSAIKFAHDQLAFIGSQYGLVQAVESAHMVSQTKDFEDW